jgi:hypothetical protein
MHTNKYGEGQRKMANQQRNRPGRTNNRTVSQLETCRVRRSWIVHGSSQSIIRTKRNGGSRIRSSRLIVSSSPGSWRDPDRSPGQPRKRAGRAEAGNGDANTATTRYVDDVRIAPVR